MKNFNDYFGQKSKKKFISAILIVLMSIAMISSSLLYSYNVQQANVDDFNLDSGFKPWAHYAADLIDTSSGNVLLNQEDFSFSGKGVNFNLKRTYNSFLRDMDGSFGRGWTFVYGAHIIEPQNEVNKLILLDEDGSFINFTYSGIGSKFNPQSGFSQYRLYNWSNGEFSLNHNDGVTRWFNSLGQLINISNSNNLALSLTYSGDKITSISDESGRFLQFTYNLNHIASISDHTNRVWKYYYDSNNNLIGVKNPLNEFKIYKYYETPIGLLQSYILETKQSILIEYDNNFRASKLFYQKINSSNKDVLSAYELLSVRYGTDHANLTDSFGTVTQVIYDANNRQIESIDGLGNSFLRTWTSDNQLSSITNPLGNSFSFSYDTHANMMSATNPFGKTHYFNYTIMEQPTKTYSLLKNETDFKGFTIYYEYSSGSDSVANITDAKGQTSFFTYTANDMLLTTYSDNEGALSTYLSDKYGQIIKSVSPENVETHYQYDFIGNIVNETFIDNLKKKTTLFEYDLLGRKISTTDPEGYKTIFVYNSGNLVGTMDPLGNWENITYNERGYPYQETDKGGNAISYSYDRNSRVALQSDPNGMITKYGYDKLGNVLFVTHPDGTKISYTYDNLGRKNTETYPGKFQYQYFYDKMDRLVSILFTDLFYGDSYYVIQNTFDDNGNLIVSKNSRENNQTYFYDELNQIIAKQNENGFNSTFKYDSIGNLVEIIDEDGGNQTFIFDKERRISSKIDELGNLVSYIYEFDNLIEIIDQRGFSTYMKYDDLGNVIEITDPLLNKELYSYDALKRMVNKTDKLGNLWKYEYDSNGLLIKTINPQGSEDSYTYDKVGNLQTHIDVLGAITTYEYDALNREISRIDNLGHSENKTYDFFGNIISITDAIGSKTLFVYDVYNNVIENTDPLGNIEKWAYDSVGNIFSYTDQSENITFYVYDKMNRLTKVTDPSGNYSTYTWSNASKLLTFTNNRGGVIEHVYDLKSQIVNRTDATGNITTYWHDEIGNIIKIRNARGYNISYEYNAVNQLISVSDPSNERTFYDYDAYGRRTNITDANTNWKYFIYDNIGNLIQDYSQLHTIDYVYDNKGNLLNETNYGPNSPKATTSYLYNSVGSLVSETNPLGNIVWSYSYDKKGNMVTRTNGNGNTWTYDYDIANNLIKTTEPTGNFTSYSHTPTGKLKTRTYSDGNVTQYKYDNRNWLSQIIYPAYNVDIKSDAEGNVIQVTNGGYLFDNSYYNYDILNRLTNYTVLLNNSMIFQINYDYDENGNRIARRSNLGSTNYTYDINDRLYRITEGDYLNVTYFWDLSGRLSEIIHNTASKESYKYDSLDRVVEMNITNSTFENVYQELYEYDSRNNIIKKQQIRSSNGNYDLTFLYIFNLDSTLKSWEVYNTDNSDILFTNYTYDKTGKIINIHGNATSNAFDNWDPFYGVTIDQSFFYDTNERIISRTNYDNNVTTYEYDKRGNRVSEYWNDTLYINFIYDLENRLVEMYFPLTDSSFFKFWTAELEGVQNFLLETYKLTSAGVTEFTIYNYDLTENLNWWLHYKGPDYWSREIEGPAWSKLFFDMGKIADHNRVSEFNYHQLNTNYQWPGYYVSKSHDTLLHHSDLKLFSGLEILKKSSPPPPIDPSAPPSYIPPTTNGNYSPHGSWGTLVIEGIFVVTSTIIEDSFGTSVAVLDNTSGNLGQTVSTTPTSQYIINQRSYSTPHTLQPGLAKINGGMTNPVDNSDIIDTPDVNRPGIVNGGLNNPIFLTPGGNNGVVDLNTPGVSINNPKNDIKKAETNINLAKLLSSLINDLIDDFMDTFINEALKALGASLLTSALGSLGRKFQSQISGFVGTAVSKSGVGSILSNAIKSGGFFNSIKQNIRKLAKDMLGNNLPRGIKDIAKDLILKCLPLANILNKLKDKLKNHFGNNINDLAKNLAKKLVNLPAIKSIINKLVGKIGRAIITKVVTLLARIGLRFIPIIGQILAIYDIAQTIWSLLPTAWKNGVTKWLKNIGSNIKAGVKAAFDGLVSLGQQIYNQARSFVNNPVKTVSGWFTYWLS